jgi:Ca2+-transporting ATPase
VPAPPPVDAPDRADEHRPAREDVTVQREEPTGGGTGIDPPSEDLDGLDPARGLSLEEASRRLAIDGLNDLPAALREPGWRRVARHLLEPMSLLLASAALVAWIGLGEGLDALAIVAIVILNAAIGSWEEGKAERALDALRNLEAPSATVIREGSRSIIDAREVVRGDVIVLTAGDRVPADLLLVDTSLLEIDESILTGESLAVSKSGGPTSQPREEGADRALAGTLVVGGSGLGVVEETGRESSIGRIAAHLEDPQRSTPLQRELRGVTTKLGIISIAIAVGVFVLTLARTGFTEAGLERSFLSAVALAVAAVPEGLATVVAVALALGVRRMAARGAIVRRLPAVETLGAATVILTDKTGTLTENRMRLDTVAVEEHGQMDWADLSIGAQETMVEAIVLCSEATIDPPTGDPLEIALLEVAGPARVRDLRASRRRIASAPFDARRRRMTTISSTDRGQHEVLHMKGAPEVVLDRCTRALGPNGERDLSEPSRSKLKLESERMAARGIRTLALATRELEGVGDDLELEERDLTFLALVGLRDPVRPHARAAVSEARAAGIDVVMITGDHPGTAAAIAVQVGLLEEEGSVLIGGDLHEGEDDAKGPLGTTVYARVDPDEKLALVERFQEAGHVVAVTGDGVNDAPALRRADIGVAMGLSGSDVAREAADMVITDDDLATIVDAVREGRGIYDNIRKVVDYLVGGNLSEITVVVGSLILFPDLGIPLFPLQLLWINLLTDGLPALALGLDPAAEGLMRRAPRPTSRRLLAIAGLPLLAWRALLIAGAAIGSLAVSRFAFEDSWGQARTVMFSTLVVTHLLYAFVVRGGADGRERPRLRDVTTNPWLLVGVGTGLLFQVVIVAWPAAREVFGTTSLPASGWSIVAAAAAFTIVAMLATARSRE